VVHVRSRAPAFSAIYAARRARTPVVTTYHGIYAARSPLKRWYNSVMTGGDAVIANSSFTGEHILAEHRVAPDKVVVIPEGVDTTAFDPAAVSVERIDRVREAWGIPGDRPHALVLVAGRLTGWKGHRVIIHAVARAAARARAHLVFVGNGEQSAYAAELVAEAKAAGVEVLITGPCDDMPAAYLAATLVAGPSTEPESFGRVVVEAAAMERVVIASRLGGPMETIVHGQTGWLATPGDADAWAAALDRALTMNPSERAGMGAAARARIRAVYSLERMCETTFDLYRRLSEARK
jgi:glycosyltransferase involved in cell wall biosynthesis